MKRQKKSSSGFTLVELLVAITIFSLVVGMAMFSLRFSFDIFRHLDAPFAEETRRNSMLRDSISSTFAYVGERSDIFNRNKEFYIYYYGESDQLTFISTKPMSVTGPALCKLLLRDGSVVLDEVPLYAADANYLSPAMDSQKKQSTVVFSDVKKLSLEYSAGEKQYATLKETLPSLVRMVVTGKNGEQEYFYRIPVNYMDKSLFVRGLNAPL